MRIVITGGHHSSALPVIKKLREERPEAQIYWFGHKYSALGDKNPTLEFREITALGIPFYHIHAGKFYRTFNLKRLAKIPYGFFQCLCLLIKIKPDAILSFGGYLAVPAVLAGWILRIPSITHEQTVVAGWANRLISKFVQKVLISWRKSEKYFPKEKTYFVGIPLREEIFEARSSSFVFGNKLPVVYITTGKIGSHIINKVVGECLGELLKFCNIIHQCGDNSVFNDFDALNKTWSDLQEGAGFADGLTVRSGDREYIEQTRTFNKGEIAEERQDPDRKIYNMGTYHLRTFVLAEEIGEAYQKADLVVSRSGAHTTAELLALRKRCILIPISWVSHNEQYENAKLLVKAGLGVILLEKDLSAQNFVGKIKEILFVKDGLSSVVSNRANPALSEEAQGSIGPGITDLSVEDAKSGDNSDPADLIVRHLLAVVKSPERRIRF